MLMYNLIEYSSNYSKTSGSSYRFCWNKPNNIITNFEWFKFKSKFLDNTNNALIINAKRAVPLKFARNFWRTGEVTLINCKISLVLSWSENCVNFEGNRVITFIITDTKLYVTVVTLSTQDNTNYCNSWNQDSNAQLNGINQK